MKIYTYHQFTNFKNINYIEKATSFLKLWQKNWSNLGFEPIILNKAMIQDKPLYKKYCDFVKYIHFHASGQKVEEHSYHMATHLEHLAFAYFCKDFSLFSDCDIFNISLSPSDITSNPSSLTWFHRACPCFMSGNAVNFFSYIDYLFENKEDIIKHCHRVSLIKDPVHGFRKFFTDQDFLMAIFKKGLDDRIFYKFNNTYVGEPNLPKEPYNIHIPSLVFESKLVHLSHKFCHDSSDEHTLTTYDRRIQFAKIYNKLSLHKKAPEGA